MNVDSKVIKVKGTQSTEGQTRITCPPQLANGLDTLKISFWIEWEDNLFLDELEQLKKTIQSIDSLRSGP